jgi:sugar transferase (PEP-CTERM system associated)
MSTWSINRTIRIPLLFLGILEFLVLYSSVYFAGLVVFGDLDTCKESFGSLATPAVGLALVMLCSLIAMGLYQFHSRATYSEVAIRVIVAVAAGIILLATIYYILSLAMPDARMVITAVAYATVLLLGFRFAFVKHLDKNMLRRRTLIFGAGNRAAAMLDLRRRADRRGFRIVTQVPAPGDCKVTHCGGLLPGDTSLVKLAREKDADVIVIAMDDRRGNMPIRDLLDCKLAGIEVVDIVEFLEKESGKIRLDLVNPGWLIFTPGFRITPLRRFAKRTTDLIIGVLGLALALPIMLLISIAIKFEDGLRSPVFYMQRRVGYLGNTFQLVKFRSMSEDAEADKKAVWASQDDDRTTRVGRHLRRSRLDELPQLLNVLAGQMSIVGPRPERPAFVRSLSESIPYYQERHSVKSGITGWAQVQFPYGSTEEDAKQKLQYDLYYVKNQNLILDLLIILETAEVILWGKGAR